MARPPFQLLQIDHLVLRARDAAAMQAFYCDVLGCTLERRRDDIGLLQLRAGRSLIDLVEVTGKLGRAGGAAPGAEGRNLDHLCLRVTPFDAEAVAAYLRSHGVTPGEPSARYGAEGEGPSLYLSDPEGNAIELKGPPYAASVAAGAAALASDTTPPATTAAPAVVASWVLRMFAVMKREPVLFVTLGYLFISFVGMWANYWFYSRFDLQVLEYMQASDFLVAGLRDPRYVLVLAGMLAVSWLVTWPQFLKQRDPQRAARLRRKWGIGWLFSESRLMRWPGMSQETGLVFGFVWGGIWLLWAYVVDKANDIRDGGGHVVAVTMADQRPLAGDIRLLGTSSAFVFLWWPGEKRAEALPIESIARIAALADKPLPRSKAVPAKSAPTELVPAKSAAAK